MGSVESINLLEIILKTARLTEIGHTTCQVGNEAKETACLWITIRKAFFGVGTCVLFQPMKNLRSRAACKSAWSLRFFKASINSEKWV